MASSPRINPAITLQIDRLATAVAKDPRSKEFLPLADEYMKAGMWQEAAVVLEDGLKVYPGFVTAMAALGRVYDQLGQPGKAKAILEAVVKQRPDNLRAHRILAKLYHTAGKTDLALQSCTALLNANPSDEEARSLQRSLTGAPDTPSQAKREKTRRSVAADQDTARAALHNVTSAEIVARPDGPSPAEQCELPPRTPPAPHAATIARLEAWLHAIHTHRQTDPA